MDSEGNEELIILHEPNEEVSSEIVEESITNMATEETEVVMEGMEDI